MAMARMACSRTAHLPGLGGAEQGPVPRRRPRARVCPGPGRRCTCTQALSSSSNRRHKPSITAGVAPASFGSTWVACDLHLVVRILQQRHKAARARPRSAVPTGPGLPRRQPAPAGRRLAARPAPRPKPACVAAQARPGRGWPGCGRRRPRPGRPFPAPPRRGRGLTHLAERFGSVAAHLRVEMPQRTDQGGNGRVGRAPPSCPRASAARALTQLS